MLTNMQIRRMHVTLSPSRVIGKSEMRIITSFWMWFFLNFLLKSRIGYGMVIEDCNMPCFSEREVPLRGCEYEWTFLGIKIRSLHPPCTLTVVLKIQDNDTLWILCVHVHGLLSVFPSISRVVLNMVPLPFPLCFNSLLEGESSLKRELLSCSSIDLNTHPGWPCCQRGLQWIIYGIDK